MDSDAQKNTRIALEAEEDEIETIATKDTLALVGFVLGLIGFLMGLIPDVAWPLDLAGIIFSILGWNSKHWGSFAKAGVILGALGFMWSSGLFVLGVISFLVSGGKNAGQ